MRRAAVCALKNLAPKDLAPHAAALTATLLKEDAKEPWAKEDAKEPGRSNDLMFDILLTLGKLAPADLVPHAAAIAAFLKEKDPDFLPEFLKQTNVPAARSKKARAGSSSDNDDVRAAAVNILSELAPKVLARAQAETAAAQPPPKKRRRNPLD